MIDIVYQAGTRLTVLQYLHCSVEQVLQYGSTSALLLGTMPSNFAKLLLETETEESKLELIISLIYIELNSFSFKDKKGSILFSFFPCGSD